MELALPRPTSNKSRQDGGCVSSGGSALSASFKAEWGWVRSGRFVIGSLFYASGPARAGGGTGGAPTASLCLLSVRLSVRGQGAASPHVSPVPSASICLHEARLDSRASHPRLFYVVLCFFFGVFCFLNLYTELQ